MSTTTIRIEDDLKNRLAKAAQRAGKTPHAYIVDAIAQTVEAAELDDEFHRVADKRWSQLLADGKSVPLDQAKIYLEARARGDKARRPSPRQLKR